MLQKGKCILYTGGHKGAETAFGEAAEKYGIQEVNFTFAGAKMNREKNAVVLTEAELKRGDISMELASNMMHRNYYEGDRIRKVLQTIFHMLNNGHQVFGIGKILDDNIVKGGTGWAVELGKLFNRPVTVFDQEKSQWFSWKNGQWLAASPKITHETFVGSGTRNLNEAGKQAIDQLFHDSFAKK